MNSISIIPSDLNLVSNQPVVEQNDTVLLTARLLDQNRDVVPNQTIILYINNPAYPAPLRISEEQTDQKGIVMFQVSMKSPGDFQFVAGCNSVLSPQCNVKVNLSLTPRGPRSWQGVINSLTRMERDLSVVMDQMTASGRRPTKAELCAALGLDYSLARDRMAISTAIYDLKMWFDYLWRNLYEPSSSFPRDFARFMQDTAGYAAWKTAPNSVYNNLINVYHLAEDEIHEAWVLSRMWGEFISTANNMYGLHFMVSFYDRTAQVYYYFQPDFWQYVEKQIQSGERLAKGLRTILTRHRDFGMMLTSGEPAYKALEDTDATLKMITDSAPPIRCELCWRNGVTIEFQKTDDLYSHIKTNH